MTRARAVVILISVVLGASHGAAQELKGGWQVLPGGWLYAYEAGAEDNHCDLAAGGNGPPCDLRLDGAWGILPGSDAWDGSALGAGVGSPGGMAIESLTGQGDGGGDASVLRIVDPGDPRDNGFADPGSNRKIYQGYDLATSGVATDASPFDEGVTLLFRFRQLKTEEMDPFDTTDPDADGTGYAPFSTLKSVLGVVSRTFGSINLGFTVLDGKLVVNNVVSELEPRVEIPLCDPTSFVSVWASAVNEGGQVHLTLWIDGGLLPAFDGLVTLGGDTDDFADGARSNYLYLGLGATGQAGAFDVDYLCFLDAYEEPNGPAGSLHCPPAIACQSLFENGKSRVEITWSNVDTYDGHSILRDGTSIATLPGGDSSYTDTSPPAGDHTYKLESSKRGQNCGDDCPGLSCTVTVTGTSIQCITDFQCEFDGTFSVWSWKNNDDYTELQMRILLALGEVTGAGGAPCVDGGGTELVNDTIPPDSESISSSIFGENQLTPGSIAVIELTAKKNAESCDPITVECPRASLCPADLVCTFDGTNVTASWTAGAGLTTLTVQLEDEPEQELDPLSTTAALDPGDLEGTVTVRLTPAACVGSCDPITCEVDLSSTSVSFHRGDSDNNGRLELTDAIRILGYLFLGSIAPTCLDAADADGNNGLELTDAIRILNYLFIGGAAPVSPGPPPEPCGPDNDATHLGCEVYDKC